MEWVSKRERLLVFLYGLGVFLASLFLLSIPMRAFAADLEIPVPSAVIYPGQNILDQGVSPVRFTIPGAKVSAYVIEDGMLIDKVARRTLLPNQPILLSDLKSPDVVRAGVATTIVYREAGIFITGLGVPLASASEGDMVRVRNFDSGVTISGIVAADGSIEVRSQ